MKHDARRTALEILQRCEKKNCTLDKSLGDAEDALSTLSQKDRNLTHALVFGILRNRARLDQIIRKFSKTPFEKISPAVINTLRLGLFQKFFMDRIPDFAAINTSVELAKRKAGQRSSGFVNAILRAAFKAPLPELPSLEAQPDEYISLDQSLPLWLIQRWMKTHGLENTQSLCKQINQIPLLTLRVNELKIQTDEFISRLQQAGYQVEPARHSPHALHLKTPGAVDQIPGYGKGWFQVQDEAAQLVSLILDPQPGENILDACAGLGGKSAHMAQLMENQGTLTALDLDGRKLTSLRAEAKRLGISIIQTQSYNLRKAQIKDFSGFFDRVLIDAPCTGLGVMRRNPDTKWKRSLGDIQRLSGQQKKLLNAAANLVNPGGILVFAVCSCEPEENEEVIQAFLSKRKDYELDTQFCLEKATPVKEGIPMPNHHFKTYPNAAHMDGFFAARLRRIPRDK